MNPNNFSDFENQLRSLKPASLDQGLKEKLQEIPGATPVARYWFRKRPGSYISRNRDGFLSALRWRKWLVISLPSIAVAALVFLLQRVDNPSGGGHDIAGNLSNLPASDQWINPTFQEVDLADSDFNQQVFVETRHLVPGISMGSTDIPLELIHKVGLHQLYFPESADGVSIEVAFPIRQISFRPADIY